MTSHIRTHSLVLLLATSLALITSSALVRADEAPGIETVVVTAEKRAEAANSIGMSIQAFSGARLTENRVTSLKDLGTVVPSFTVSQGYQGVPIYSLRGIGFNTINLSATSTVGTYVDEVAYAYPFMMTGPFFDIQRVEVLKGPQGTLYGRNTTAGLIDVITNKPSDTLSASLTAEGGNYATHNFEGYVTGPLGQGLSGRFAFRTEDSDDGWQTSNTRPNETLGEKHNYAARGELTWQPEERLVVNFTLNGWINQSDSEAAQAIGLTTSNQCPATLCYLQTPGLLSYLAKYPPTGASQADWEPAAQRVANIGTGTGLNMPLAENDDFYSAVVRADYALNDSMSLVSLTSYNHVRRNGTNDWSGAPYELMVVNEFGHVGSFSQELRLQGDTDSTHWIAGAYYGNDSIDDEDRTILGQNSIVQLIRGLGQKILATPFLNAIYNTGGYTPLEMSQAFRTYTDRGAISTSTWSIFADADWKFADAFKLTGGLRYTQDHQGFRGCSADVNGNMLPNENVVNRYLYTSFAGGIPHIPDMIDEGGCATFNAEFVPVFGIPARQFGELHTALNEDNLAARAALDWTPAKDTLVYLSFSRGFKAGDIPILPANIASQERPAKQEQVLAYETGVKTALFDGRAQLNFAGFYYDYYDKQLRVLFRDPIYTVLARLDNIPRSHAYGLDGDFAWAITDRLIAGASATYLQTYLGDYLGVASNGGSQQYRGSQYPLSPEWQGALWASYSQPVGGGYAMDVLVNEHFQAKSCADLCTDPAFRLNSYALLNASIALHPLAGAWRVALWGQNLTDVYTWTIVTGNSDVNVRFAGMPRTFGASLSYNFD